MTIGLIGDFRFLEVAPATDVALVLSLSPNGERLGRIRIDAALRAMLLERGFPDADEELPLESALGLAVAVASRAQRPLTITGDPSAWNASWGLLMRPDA